MRSEHQYQRNSLNFAILWDESPCNPYANRRFGGMHHDLFSNLKIEFIRSSETSVRMWTIWPYMLEDDNIHNYCCEILRSYNVIVRGAAFDECKLRSTQ
jgi:hypothetical protein